MEDSSLNKPEKIIINLESEFKRNSREDENNTIKKDNDATDENNNVKVNKKKKEPNIDLEKLTKKERRRYKKLRKAMHLLRKAIRSYKKRKKKGLIKIDDEDLLRKCLKKWKNIALSSNKDNIDIDEVKDTQKDENDEIEEQNKDSIIENKKLRINKLKEIVNKVEKKIKENILKYLRKWYKLTYTNVFPKVIFKKDKNYLNLSDKEIKITKERQITRNNTNNQIFQKKNIPRRKYLLNNNINKINTKAYNTYNNNIIKKDEENIIHIKENKSPEINKKIKFSIKRREKSQVIVFNNFNIKDINGRKEIILNKIKVPKDEYLNYNNNLYNLSSDNNRIKTSKLNIDDDENNEIINNSEPIINTTNINTTFKKEQGISNSYQEISLDKIMKLKKKKNFNRNIKEKIGKLSKIINKFNKLLIKEKYFMPWFKKSQIIKNKEKLKIKKNIDKIESNKVIILKKDKDKEKEK